MPKLAVIALLAVIAAVSQGFPTQGYDIASAAAAGNWDEVHNLITKMYQARYGIQPLLDDDFFTPVGDTQIRTFNPGKGQYYGEAEYTFHSAATDAKGQTHQQSGGHKVINDNGKVTEFDFKPPQSQLKF